MLIAISKQDAHTAELLGRDTVKICEMQGLEPRLENEKQSRVDANIAGTEVEVQTLQRSTSSQMAGSTSGFTIIP